MASTVDVAYVNKYNASIRLLQQQATSRFRPTVMLDLGPELVGEKAYYDQLDSTSMTPVTDRHGKTQITDDEHKRRAVTFAPAEKASLLDRADARRILNDPRNRYAQNHVNAANRWFDDQVVPAFFADALTGKEGGGTAEFPSSGFDVTAGSGMTADALTSIREILEAAENEEDDGDFMWCGALSARQRRDMLRQEKITSSDYASIKALVNGQVDTYMGFTFVKSERLTASGTDRLCPFWVKASMQGAISQDIRTDIDILPERRHSWQVRTEIDCGATRMDEKGVVRVTSDETP